MEGADEGSPGPAGDDGYGHLGSAQDDYPQPADILIVRCLAGQATSEL